MLHGAVPVREDASHTDLNHDGPSPLELAHAAVRLPAAALAGDCGDVNADRSSPAHRKAALLSIVDHAGASVWAMHVATIAGETGHGERTTRRALAWLERAGWITRERMHRDDGRPGIYAYRANVDAIVAASPRARARESGPADRSSPVQRTAREGDQSAGGPEDSPPQPERSCTRAPAREGGQCSAPSQPSPRAQSTAPEPNTGSPTDLLALAEAVAASCIYLAPDPTDTDTAEALSALLDADPEAIADLAERDLPEPIASPRGMARLRLQMVARDPAAVRRRKPDPPPPDPSTCDHSRVAELDRAAGRCLDCGTDLNEPANSMTEPETAAGAAPESGTANDPTRDLAADTEHYVAQLLDTLPDPEHIDLLERLTRQHGLRAHPEARWSDLPAARRALLAPAVLTALAQPPAPDP